MKRALWLQLFALSLLFSLVLSAIGLTVFRWIAAPANAEARKNIYLFLANVMESAPYPEAMRALEKFRAESPSLASNIWVISADDHVYATNTTLPPPPEWKTMTKPQHAHELSLKMQRFQLFADLALVRLADSHPTFVLIKPRDQTPAKSIAYAEMTLLITGLFGAACGGLAMTFIYLRKTSREAKHVISRLHAGDLQARFTIKKLDEIGNLKLDFNAMADQIEHLVRRVQQIENTRKQLLQELGHDLRTPLTSLRTSVETLTMYREQMTCAQQQEFFSVIQSELDYFVRLLEDLFFIADIAEPGYKTAFERVDVAALLRGEVHARQLAQPQLQWQLHCAGDGDATIAGDAHLILRLLRNTLDNAAKYARTQITIATIATEDHIEITIADDGAGMDADKLRTFGARRKYRERQQSAQHDLSLGLGSVIIKTIVDLHGGSMRIESSAIDANLAQGTRFIFLLPRAGSAQ